MSSARPTRLTDITAPMPHRQRYASLTAGLLARKGEASPASPFVNGDPYGLHAGPAGARIALDPEEVSDWAEDSLAQGAMPPRAHEAVEEFRGAAHAPHSGIARAHSATSTHELREIAAWLSAARQRLPREGEPAALHPAARRDIAHEVAPAPDLPKAEIACEPNATPKAAPRGETLRASLNLELELEILARLVINARRKGENPAQLVEAALAAFLPQADQ